MSLSERIYSALIVSAADSFNDAVSALLPESKYSPVDFVSSVSAAKRAFSERAFDYVIINSPLPETKAICIYHRGAYDCLGDAYAYITKCAGENGYKISGCPRECYIDGIRNKENTQDRLTEIQLPVE